MVFQVMIVEDSELMQQDILDLLRNSMPELEIVATAINGRIALEQLDELPALDLILLDVEMPEMSGLEFLRHAKLRCRAKILILSSVTNIGSPNAIKARKLGADAIVTKPSGAVSMDLEQKRGTELAQVIRKLLNF
ncbi:MAG: response regulator [Rhodospirillaceae bacterium]